MNITFACDETENIAFFSDEKKIEVLENKLSQANPDSDCRVDYLLKLSEFYRAENKLGTAREYAERAVQLAREPQTPVNLLSEALTVAGNTRLYTGNYAKALAFYSEALTHTQKQADTYKVLINIAQLWTDAFLKELSSRFQKDLCGTCRKQDIYAHALTAFQTAFKISPASSQTTNPDNTLHLAQIAYRLKQQQEAVSLLRSVLSLSSPTSIQFSHAYALLGQIYFEAQSYSDATQLLHQAIFHAQQAQAVDLLFRWQRRLGQVYKAQNKLLAAIKAYQSALDFLKKIRPQVLQLNRYADMGKELRNTEQAQVYLELMAVLLEAARLEKNVLTRQVYLHQVLAVLEGFKTVELQDYYQDDCISGVNKSNTSVEQGSLRQTQGTVRQVQGTDACENDQENVFAKLTAQDAVLYPIALENKLVVLLYHQNRIWLSDEVDIEPVNATVNKIFRALSTSKSGVQSLKADGNLLYQWLITPFVESLQEVKTLIVVPDGQLRTIPFAVFYDAVHQQYLLQQFALAVVPSLSLTQIKERRPLKRVFMNGFSLEKPKFPALKYVNKEMAALKELFPETQLLQDKNFTLHNFHQEAGSYRATAVHIATHGEFKSKVADSYLLTYDKPLKMQDLEVLSQHNVVRGEPLELLTLSACESAKGDERAALGLSGVAIKAGAKTALASLWKVSDASTCYLMARFYALLQASVPAAQALRRAQLELLENTLHTSHCLSQDNYQHPYYWAAFIVLGNWL